MLQSCLAYVLGCFLLTSRNSGSGPLNHYQLLWSLARSCHHWVRYCAYSTFIRLISGETTSTMFLSRVGSTQEYTMGEAWNSTDFPTPAEDSQKHRFSIPLLDAYWGYQTQNLHTLSWTHFSTRVCESSTHDLCVLPLQICKVKCDWFLSADVTDSSSQTLFSAETTDRKYVSLPRRRS